ncbi:PTS sorbitol transporter subunit IIC [Salmonella enterica subsp. diarizonae]|nr:PTS sorbitol transporter subunit IIC [Salmonella enterica subsp. diarizonae]
MVFLEIAKSFVEFFKAAGDTFLDMITSIIPMLMTLLLVVNFLMKLVGEKRIEKLATLLGKYRILTYGVLPPISWFLLSFPGALTIGKLLPERNKLPYQDALLTTAHPLTSLFPHVLPSELFIWLGVTAGIVKLGLPVEGLALRLIGAAIIVAIIRGFITEFIFIIMQKRQQKKNTYN